MKELLITSSVLILALLVLRWVFGKKVRRTFIYGAWVLVALRLLVPVQIGELRFSVLTAAQPVLETVEERVNDAVLGTTPQAAYRGQVERYIEKDQTVFVPEVQEQIKQELAQGNQTPGQIYDKIQQQFPEQEILTELGQELVSGAAGFEVSDTLHAFEVTMGRIWFAGIAVMAIWFAVVNLRHSRMLRRNREKLECDSPIPVYVSDKVGSPCLVGMFRPVVYLTPESATPERLRHVLTHELTHYAHDDHLWSVVRCICLCVYWFHPLVWVAAWFSRRDCELACDEGALKRLGEDERIAYGKTLLDVVSRAAAHAHLLQTATAMNETKKQLKERVNFIVKRPKLSIIAAVCMVLVCAIVAGCVAAGPISAEWQIKRDAVARFSGPKDTCKPEEVDLTIISRFGNIYALFVDVPFLAYLDINYQECVNDLTFNYPDSRTMYIYSAGQFYKFQEAFDEKIITAAQLTTIWEDYYEKYPNRKDLESSLKPIVPNPTDPTQPTEPTQPAAPAKRKVVYLLETEREERIGTTGLYNTNYQYDEEGNPTAVMSSISRDTLLFDRQMRTLKILSEEGDLLGEITYDEMGRMETYSIYNGDMTKWIYTYEGDLLVNEMWLTYRQRNDFTYELWTIRETQYAYDENGCLVSEHTYQYTPDTPEEQIEQLLNTYVLWYYGEDGRPSRTEEYDRSGVMVHYSEYTYDDENSVKMITVYEGRGSWTDYYFAVHEMYITTYDEHGNVIREEVRDNYWDGEYDTTVTTYTYISMEVPEDYWCPEW